MSGIVDIEVLDNDGLADFFFQDVPMRLTSATAYFRVKAMQTWGARVKLHPWDSWDLLADRLEQRLGQHIWHPSHWDAPAEKDLKMTSHPSLFAAPPPRQVPAHEALLQLCAELSAAGIWLYLNDAGALVAGPERLLKAQPALL